MGIDQEAIRKRFSQLEMDINSMNKMIDDNLQIGETGDEEDKKVEPQDVNNGVVSPKKFSEVTAQAAAEFVNTAAAKPVEEPLTVERVGQDLGDNRAVETETVAGPAAAEPVEQPVVANRAPVELTAPIVPETGNTTDHVIDQTTDTSQDFTTGNVTTAISSNSSTSSFSSPASPAMPIFIPKNNAETNRDPAAPTAAARTTLRRPTNPFRVVSVGTAHSEGPHTRKPSDEPKVTDADSVTKLQKRLDYLTKKCLKLQKEIRYLNDMNYKNTLSIDDGRKLASAIDKLQEYLDRKTKEKYDLGVLVSRQLRKEIDRGENGQFWIGTK